MAGSSGGVATPPTPKTRGSFEWYQRRRAKWEQAPRPKVISLSSAPKAKPTTDIKDVSAKKATSSSTASSLSFTPVSADAKERSETKSQQQQQGPFSSDPTSTKTSAMKITDSSVKTPLQPPSMPPAVTKPKPNPFANISLTPSSSSSLSLQSASTTADTLKANDASKSPLFGGLSSSSSPFTSFGSKPTTTQSSSFGISAPEFAFGGSSNPTTTAPASSNLFGGGSFSATLATAKPFTSTPVSNTTTVDEDKTNKMSIVGKPVNAFSATSTNIPATIESKMEANKSSPFTPSAAVPRASAKANTVSKVGGAFAETSSTESKTNANPFATVQLVVPDKTTTKSVLNNSASSKSEQPSQQQPGEASNTTDKAKTATDNSDSAIFKALAVQTENKNAISGISTGSTIITEKKDVDAMKQPFSFGTPTLSAKPSATTTNKTTANPFANVQLVFPSSASGTNTKASTNAAPHSNDASGKPKVSSSSSSSYPPLSAKAPTPFSVTSGVSAPATSVTDAGGDVTKAIQPVKVVLAEPATAAGKKAAKAFDKIDVVKDSTLSASSFETLLEELGENFHGDEYDEQLAICDPTKSGSITRKDFVDWYVDLVEGDDSDDDGSIDTEEREERAEEEANAREKFGEVGKMVDGSLSMPASEFGDLIESLGSAYCEEAHRSTLKKLTSSNGMIREDDFLAWYVEWLFAGDSDSEDEDSADGDTNEVKSEDKPSLSSLFRVDAGTWRCEMCSVPNKEDAKKCAACETARPGMEGDTDTTRKEEKSHSLKGSIGSGGFSFGAPTAGGSIGSSGFSFGAPSGSSGSTNAATASSTSTSGGFTFGAPSTSSGATNDATALPTSTSGGFTFGAPSTGSGATNATPALPSSTSVGFTFGAPSTGSDASNTATDLPASNSGVFSFGAPSAISVSTNTATTNTSTSRGFSFGASSDSTNTAGGFSFSTPSTSGTGGGNTTTGGFNFAVSSGTSTSTSANNSAPIQASAIDTQPPSSSSYPPLSATAPTPFSAVRSNPGPSPGGANTASIGSAYPPIASKSPTPLSSLGTSSAQAKPPSSSSAYPPLSSKAPTPFSAAASAKPSAGANAGGGGGGTAYPPIASKSPTPFSSLGKPAKEAAKPSSSSSAYPPMSAKPPTPFSATSAKPSAGSSSAYPPIASKSPTPFSALGDKPDTKTPSPAPASSAPAASSVQAPESSASESSRAPAPAPYSFGNTFPKSSTAQSPLPTSNPFATMNLTPSKTPDGKPMQSIFGAAIKPAPKFDFGSSQPKTANPFAGTSLLAAKKPPGEKESEASKDGSTSSEKPKTTPLFGGTTANVFATKSASKDKTNPFGGKSFIATTSAAKEKQPSNGVAFTASAEDNVPGATTLASSEKPKMTPLFGGTTNLFATKSTSLEKPNPFGGTHLNSKSLSHGEKQPSDGVATSAPAAKPSPFTSTGSFAANPSSGPSPFSGGGNSGTSMFSTKAAPSKPFGSGAKASNFSNPMFGAVSPFSNTVATPGISPSKGATERENTETEGSIDYRTRLVKFYKKYNPEKIDSVDATLEKFKGKEDELFKRLERKYAQSGFPLPSGNGPTCFLDFSIDGMPAGRVVVKLYQDKTPLAVENFRCLCTGEKGVGRSMKPLHFKTCKVHRVVPGFCVQLGDFTKGNGTGGESIYPPGDQHANMWGRFVDEPFMRHARKGLLSMANNGPNQNGSQFFFTLRPCPNLDGKHVVFGEVVEGFDVVDKIADCDIDAKSAPKVPVTVVDCGEIRV